MMTRTKEDTIISMSRDANINFDSALVNEMVPSAWLSIGALEV